MHGKFTAHDKRVTLNLARHSACCQQNQPLMDVLWKLPQVDWDISALPQQDVEILYAEFDDALEAKIKSEFVADPGFLIDLGATMADSNCPLCGHPHIRWLFKIQNLNGGKDVTCGSTCIVTHGLSVKGAETAEHAREILERAISKQKRKLLIQGWHRRAEFTEDLPAKLLQALNRIRYNDSDFQVRNSARYKISSLYTLKKFYNRSGWLGTEKKWEEWRRLAKFARKFDEQANTEIPFPKDWAKVNPKVAAPQQELIEVLHEPAPEPAPKPIPESAPKKEGQLELPFNKICRELLSAQLGI